VAKPEGAIRVWLPLPLAADTDWFKTLNNSWSGNASSAKVIPHSRYDTALFYAEWPGGTEQPAVEVVSRFATRDRALDWANPGKVEPVGKAILARYLEPNEHIPTDGIVLETARKATKGARGDVEKARAIYEWIVDNTFRDPKTRGCGIGDIKAMLESGNLGGKCADLNALFVGLARAAGIPARDVYGIRVVPSQWGYKSLGAGSSNITRAQHCRAEFHSAAFGWVPVDPADVRKVVLEEPPGNLPIGDDKVKLARAKLFGAWEMNWLAYNYAQEVLLPSGRGAKVAFLMYPQCETASGRKDSLDPDHFKYQISARDYALRRGRETSSSAQCASRRCAHRSLLSPCAASCCASAAWRRTEALDRRRNAPLALKDPAGKPHELADYRGRVVLVNFWATWCAPCREEMPSMQALRERFAGNGFEVLAVNVMESAETIAAFRESELIDLPVLMDRDGEAAKRWKVRAMPKSFVIDRRGAIRYQLVGEANWTGPDIAPAIERLIGVGAKNQSASSAR
jgi:transglutaminase-like putative cysteine protease/thiol-disulfide isomerase/thioredoxin